MDDRSKSNAPLAVANRDRALVDGSLADRDDAELIQACLAGEELAWEALIERYSRLIYTIPLRFGFSQLVADEIFQETCLILLERLDTLRERQRLNAWLVTVTRRVCIQRWRQKEASIPVGSVEPQGLAGDDLEDQLLRVERQHLVRQAVGNLDERCQQLLAALFFEVPPWSYETIAQALELPLGSIGPMRARCLEKLRLELAKIEDRSGPGSPGPVPADG